jgi:hypothetical protein
MPAERLDVLEDRIADVEARLTDLAEEFAAVSEVVSDGPVDGRDAVGDQERAPVEEPAGEADFAPPDGASQAAVDAAVSDLETAEDGSDREEQLII